MRGFVRDRVGCVASVLEVRGSAQKDVGAYSRLLLQTPSHQGVIDVGRVIRDYDEEIPIAPWLAIAARATPEEPNPRRAAGAHDLLEEPPDGAEINVATAGVAWTANACNHAGILA